MSFEDIFDPLWLDGGDGPRPLTAQEQEALLKKTPDDARALARKIIAERTIKP